MRTPPLLALAFTFNAIGCGSAPPDPCADNPAFCNGNGTCAGQCITTPHKSNGVHLLIWSGPEGTTPPECPDGAPLTFGGYLDTPPDTVTCSGPCTCTPSQGACFPPVKIEANSASCPAAGPGVMHTPSSPPNIWDGSCAAGASVSSVFSVSVGPALLSSDRGCAAASLNATEIKGMTRVKECTTDTYTVEGTCPNLDQLCTFKKVDGFEVCLYNFGDTSCPDSWPVKHLYYEDYRACTCECGDPVGDSCSTTVTLFADDACTQPIGSTPITTDDPTVCVDVPPGSALGSKSATLPNYQAGTCSPKLTKSVISTLCCLP